MDGLGFGLFQFRAQTYAQMGRDEVRNGSKAYEKHPAYGRILTSKRTNSDPAFFSISQGP